MKKISMLTVLLLLIASANIAFAQPRGKNAQPGLRSPMNASFLSVLNLTEEQSEKILALREAHHKDMIPLRTQLFSKRSELRLSWMQANVDPAKIKSLQKELLDLTGQIQEKSTDFRLAFRKILTPEQLTKYLALELGKGCAPRGSMKARYGQGAGMRGPR